ncbi:MAG: hypothetical protein RR945_09545 [Erysipelotrichaceae bacterium]
MKFKNISNYIKANFSLYFVLLSIIYRFGYHFNRIIIEVIYFVALSTITFLLINSFYSSFNSKQVKLIILSTIIIFFLTPIYAVNCFGFEDNYINNISDEYRRNLTLQQSEYEFDLENGKYIKQIEVTNYKNSMMFKFPNLDDNIETSQIDSTVILTKEIDNMIYFKFEKDNDNYFGVILKDRYNLKIVIEELIN